MKEEEKLLEAKKLYKSNPSDKNRIRYASHLINIGKFEEAEELLNDVQDSQKQKMALVYKARIYRFKNEEKLLQETLSLLYSSEYAAEGYLEMAEFYISKMIKIKDDLKNGYYEKDENIENILVNLLEIIRQNLNKSLNLEVNGNILMRCGDIEYFERNYEMAKYYYEKILSETHKVKYKDLYNVKLRLATIYLQSNKLDLASQLAYELLKFYHQDNSNVYFLLANISARLHTYDKAKEYYLLGLQKSFKPCNILEYAKLCIEMQEYEEAKIYLKKLEGTYLKNRAFQELAKIYVILGNYNQALDMYKKMLNGNSRDKNIAHIGIGNLERLNGNFDISLSWLNKALKGNDKGKALAKIEMAKVYIDLENYDVAKELLISSIEISNDVYGKIEYAKLMVFLNDYDEAETILQKIILDNNNEYDRDQALLELSFIERKKGNYEKAKDYLKGFLYYSNNLYFKALCFLIECNLDEKDTTSAKKNIEELKKSKNAIDKEKSEIYSAELNKLIRETNTKKRTRINN